MHLDRELLTQVPIHFILIKIIFLRHNSTALSKEEKGLPDEDIKEWFLG
jgi:hypothetical protein